MSNARESSDPEVVLMAQQLQKGMSKGPVIFGDVVWHIGRTERGAFTPTLIKTMADFDKHFGVLSIETALRNR